MKPHQFATAALATFAVVLCSPVQAQETGRIKGRVLDEYNAVTLPGATVEVVDTDTIVYTDMDGVFDISLPPGSYDIRVTFSGYDDSLSEGVVVVGGETVELAVALSIGTVELAEEITVTAEAGPVATSQAAALLERKRSGAVSDGMAREEMTANADSDASDAMSRVTGVSVVGGQYVYVRGLGERYSNTTLNGSVLPTTEPDKRVVPLDLFPTALLESVKVTKSYLPDKPAEFSGGLVEIEPINFPDGPVFSISGSGGYNSNTTGKDGLSYAGGGLDWLGFDDGTRALPSSIPDQKVVPATRFGGGFSQDELTAFGRSFANVWEPRESTGKPDSSFSILAGNSWGKLGAVGSVTYNYKNRFRAERQQYYIIGPENSLINTNNYDFRYSTYRATVGAVGNLSYRFSGSHRLAWENFYTNSGQDEARTFSGFNIDKGTDLENYRLYWIQESVLSSKLSGEHFFPSLSNSKVDWRLTYSRAKRDEPDLRENLYEFRNSLGAFEWSNESQSGFRMFNDLTDNVYDAAADWTMLFSASGRSTVVKVGGQYTHRTRDFLSRRLRFKPTRARPADLTQAPEVIFQADNIGPSGDFQLEEDTRPTDRYDATHDIYAGYAMVDLPVTSRLRFVGGARMEASQQEVITSDPFDPTLGVVPASLDNTDVLPGVNLVYQLTPDQNLRAAFSQTVNRPEFRELAPFEFTDIVGGRAVVGNPDLKRAKIMNADLRWEWFPAGGAGDGEVVALSAFWKDFTDPIERVVEATAQFRNSYENAKGARNIGFEVEGRKSVGPFVLLGFNYTYTNSEIELERGAAQIQTNLNRPLAGQSPHVVNGMVEVRNRARDLSGRVLVNFYDDRISDVGVFGTPDILEEGRTTLDVVVTKTFGTWALRLTGTNLTDSEWLFSQGGELQRAYKEGRTVGLSVSYAR